MRHFLGWLVVVFMFAAVGYAAWCELLIRVQDRQDRQDLRRLDRVDTTPNLPPPPIRFDRDPSPRRRAS